MSVVPSETKENKLKRLESLRSIVIYQMQVAISRSLDKGMMVIVRDGHPDSEPKTLTFPLAEQIEGLMKVLKYVEDEIKEFVNAL